MLSPEEEPVTAVRTDQRGECWAKPGRRGTNDHYSFGRQVPFHVMKENEPQGGLSPWNTKLVFQVAVRKCPHRSQRQKRKMAALSVIFDQEMDILRGIE